MSLYSNKERSVIGLVVFWVLFTLTIGAILYLRYTGEQTTLVFATNTQLNVIPSNKGLIHNYRVDKKESKIVLDFAGDKDTIIYGIVARVRWTSPVKQVKANFLNSGYKAKALENDLWIYPYKNTSRKWVVTTVDSFPVDVLLKAPARSEIKLVLSFNLYDQLVKQVSAEFTPIIVRYKVVFRRNNKFYYADKEVRFVYKDLIQNEVFTVRSLVKKYIATYADNDFIDLNPQKFFVNSNLSLGCPLFFDCLFNQSSKAVDLISSKAIVLKGFKLFYNQKLLQTSADVWVYEIEQGTIAYHKIVLNKKVLEKPIEKCEIYKVPVTSQTQDFILYAQVRVPVGYVKVDAQQFRQNIPVSLQIQRYKVGDKTEFLLDSIKLPNGKYDRIIVYFFNNTGKLIDSCVYNFNAEKETKQTSPSSSNSRNIFKKLLSFWTVYAEPKNRRAKIVNKNDKDIFVPIVFPFDLFFTYITVHNKYKVSIKAIDPDGEFLTYFVVDAPSWANLSAQSSQSGELLISVYGQPSKIGTYNFRIGVTDGASTVYRSWVVKVGQQKIGSCLLQPNIEEFPKWVNKGELLELRWHNLGECKNKASVYLTTKPWFSLSGAKYLGDIMANLGQYAINTKALESSKYYAWLVFTQQNQVVSFIRVAQFYVGNLSSVDSNPNSFIKVMLISPVSKPKDFELNNLRFVVRLFASNKARLETNKVRVYLDGKDITGTVVFSKPESPILTLLIGLEQLNKGTHKLQIWAKDSKGQIATFRYKFTVLSGASKVAQPITILKDEIAIAGIVIPKSQFKLVLLGGGFFMLALILPFITFLIERRSYMQQEINVSNTDLETFENSNQFGPTLRPGDEIVFD